MESAKIWGIVATLFSSNMWDSLALYAGNLPKLVNFFFFSQHGSKCHTDMNLMVKHPSVSLQGMSSVSMTAFHHFFLFLWAFWMRVLWLWNNCFILLISSKMFLGAKVCSLIAL